MSTHLTTSALKGISQSSLPSDSVRAPLISYISPPLYRRLIILRVGFAGYNYYNEAQSRREFAMAEEEKRLARNRKLMDAYGSKDSLHDVQQALDTYHAR